jgi:hypothetical protein
VGLNLTDSTFGYLLRGLEPIDAVTGKYERGKGDGLECGCSVVSTERIRAKVKEIMRRLTEKLDSLFFDPIGDRRRSCYVCGSDALHECVRCNKDVCDQHAVFAETEYVEPLTYCHECFWKAVEDDPA